MPLLFAPIWCGGRLCSVSGRLLVRRIWFGGFRFGGFRFGGFRSFLITAFLVLLSASWLVPRVCHSWLRATSGFFVVGSAAADDATINQLQELINKKHFNYYLVNQFCVFNKNRISLKLKASMASITIFHGINVIFIVSMQCFWCYSGYLSPE